MESSLLNQVCFTGESQCKEFRPHNLRPNFCVSCMKLIEKHTKEAIHSLDHLQNALEHTQKGEKEASLILDGNARLGAVFLGGFKSTMNDDFLRKAKISHVLNVAGKKLRNFFGPRYEQIVTALQEELQLTVLDLEWEDSMEFQLTDENLGEAINFIEKGRKEGAVLVHCAQGKSRSAAALTAYIMAKENVNAEDAIKKIRSHRKMADPNENFRAALKRYEKSAALEDFRGALA